MKTAIDRATPDWVFATVRAGHQHLRRLGMPAPGIAVAGINAHCGEHQVFGTEGDEQIVPAVGRAQAEGINVTGPITPDTVYHRAYAGAFDLVVAEYRDQGHIPMKLVAFDTTVNTYLGLPVDRTSVDHGTAIDIAGTGKAYMNAAIAFPDTVVDIRDSSGDLTNMTAMIASFPGLAVFAGADPLLRPALESGGAGCITATSNLVSRELATVFRGARDPARKAEVDAEQEKIVACRNLSNGFGAQIAAVKTMLAVMTGVEGWANVRSPLTRPTAAQRADLREALSEIMASRA